MLERVIQLQAQVDELTRIITAQVEVTNQTTELFGRILATSSSRLEVIEETVRHGAGDGDDEKTGRRGDPIAPQEDHGRRER